MDVAVLIGEVTSTGGHVADSGQAAWDTDGSGMGVTTWRVLTTVVLVLALQCILVLAFECVLVLEFLLHIVFVPQLALCEQPDLRSESEPEQSLELLLAPLRSLRLELWLS
jgi:hypothetical protein